MQIFWCKRIGLVAHCAVVPWVSIYYIFPRRVVALTLRPDLSSARSVVFALPRPFLADKPGGVADSLNTSGFF
jgi:hypothetical protein